MGYAIAGYPTRRRKGDLRRIKLLQHANGPAEDGQRIKRRRRRNHEGLAELPAEVIQRIFVLSQNESLCLVNKFFHTVLRPWPSLVDQMIWEKYVFDPTHYGLDLKGSLVMLETVFTGGAFMVHLVENVGIVDHITRFMPQQVWQEFKISGDADKIMSWWEQDLPMDFPAVFHTRFESFVDHAAFVRRLSQFFVLKKPYSLLREFVHWFFRTERSEGFYKAVELILEVANVESCKIYSSEPLEALLQVLFAEHRSPQPLQVFRIFIDKFYSDEHAKEYLSDASLWQLLRSTGNMQVIDVVVSCGGQPHYGAFL